MIIVGIVTTRQRMKVRAHLDSYGPIRRGKHGEAILITSLGDKLFQSILLYVNIISSIIILWSPLYCSAVIDWGWLDGGQCSSKPHTLQTWNIDSAWLRCSGKHKGQYQLQEWQVENKVSQGIRLDWNMMTDLNNLDDVPGSQDGGVKLHMSFVGCQCNNCPLHPCCAHESTFTSVHTWGTRHSFNLQIFLLSLDFHADHAQQYYSALILFLIALYKSNYLPKGLTSLLGSDLSNFPKIPH